MKKYHFMCQMKLHLQGRNIISGTAEITEKLLPVKNYDVMMKKQ